MRTLLLQLHSDLQKLDSNELTLVTYDPTSHDLILNQVGKVINIGYMGLYYSPTKNNRRKKLKIGVLNQLGLNSLLRVLEELIGCNLFDKHLILPRASELKIEIYRWLKGTTPHPVKFWELNFMNIRNPLWVAILCNNYSAKSKLLYKSLKTNSK